MPKPIPRWMSAAATRRTSLALLSSLAFGTAPDLAHVTVEGIEHITADDIAFASEFGFRIKLLGVARRTAGRIDQKVHPAMVRARTPLANVDGAANGVLVDAGEAGSFFFSGRGAGEAPTASRGDRRHCRGASDRRASARFSGVPPPASRGWSRPTARPGVSPWYLRFEVLDVPGVLADIAGHLSRCWRFHRKHDPARARARRTCRHCHDHPRNRAKLRGARLEGHLRLRQGAHAALHDSHGDLTVQRLRVSLPVRQTELKS